MFSKDRNGFAADYRQKFFLNKSLCLRKTAALMDGFNFLSNVEGTIDEGTSFMSSEKILRTLKNRQMKKVQGNRY